MKRPNMIYLLIPVALLITLLIVIPQLPTSTPIVVKKDTIYVPSRSSYEDIVEEGDGLYGDHSFSGVSNYEREQNWVRTKLTYSSVMIDGMKCDLYYCFDENRQLLYYYYITRDAALTDGYVSETREQYSSMFGDDLGRVCFDKNTGQKVSELLKFKASYKKGFEGVYDDYFIDYFYVYFNYTTGETVYCRAPFGIYPFEEFKNIY